MSEGSKGVLAMVVACTVWGLSSIFYKALVHVTPLEVLAHRTLWSFVCFALVLAFQGRLRAMPAAVSEARQLALVVLAALMISTNWLLFIFSIQVGRAMESSLGYYIYPLVAVLLGRLLFQERLGRLQLVAVALAALAVTILTVGLGVAPWISLVLAFTFATYGVLKRWVAAGPVVSVTVEVALLTPLALGYLVFTGAPGMMASATDAAMLMFSGPLTALPLILFSFAAKRASMATIGLVQYLNPTLQFLSAALVLGELVTPWHMIAFPVIWAALALYSVATLRPVRVAAPT